MFLDAVRTCTGEASEGFFGFFYSRKSVFGKQWNTRARKWEAWKIQECRFHPNQIIIQIFEARVVGGTRFRAYLYQRYCIESVNAAGTRAWASSGPGEGWDDGRRD